MKGSTWELERDPPRPHDFKLTPIAAAWLAEIQGPLKPMALCERFPRIANRLALAWKDMTLTNLILIELLVDRRGGRKGFPTDVREEIDRLAVEAKRLRTK